jgi:signal transduction histidine kinase
VNDAAASLLRSLRVLVLAPGGRDSEVLAKSLREAGMDSVECTDIGRLCEDISEGAGALMVTQEALTPQAQQNLLRCLSQQPQWSALPLIILSLPRAGVDPLASFLAALGPVGTAIVVERPIKPGTLQSLLRMALFSRERQYQLRGHLAKIEVQQREITEHRDNLQALVEERTTELRESMRKFQDAQRLAALGNMAAGIGHDIANMTLPIRIRLEPLADAMSSPEAREDIAAIGKSLEHLTNLSAGLRLMALDPTRDGVSAAAVDLRKWCEQSEAIFRNGLPRGVMFECDVGDCTTLPGVQMPSHRLTQAIFNLVQNAGEAIVSSAIPRGAVKLVIRHHDDGKGNLASKQVQFTIVDNGPGIAPEHIDRIFEPYFTTKGRAIATGMGLAMVRGLVESAGGSVHVESEPGQGTSFRIVLPASGGSSGVVARSEVASEMQTAVVTVLDARQRALSEAILKGLRVQVRTVRDGAMQDVPEADVWVTCGAGPSSAESFLRSGASRRLIFLSRAGASEGLRLAQELENRVQRVPANPQPAVLRDALITAVRGPVQHPRQAEP